VSYSVIVSARFRKREALGYSTCEALPPIPHLHHWRKMEVCLINFNKGEDDEGCLKICNILKWSTTVQGNY
jgi:hypothetical protein